MLNKESIRDCALEAAVEKAQQGGSKRQVARDYGISESTLRYRLQRANEIESGAERKRRLSDLQEKSVVQWIQQLEKAGRAPKRWQIKDYAQEISAADPPLGHNWVDRFLQRHKEVKIKPSHPMEAPRIRHATVEALEPYWKDLDRLIKEMKVGPTRFWNMDETGFAEGETRAGKVAGSAESRYAIVTSSDVTTWVTAAECISAAGKVITPAVILSGEHLQGQWLPEGELPCALASQPKGWMNADIMLCWFRDIFLPETKPEIASLWRILLLDGVKSHVNEDLMQLAASNNVRLHYLPAHTSHITQPLDVGVFHVLKLRFREGIRKYADIPSTAPISKQHFLEEYKIAHEKAMTEKNIRSAFKTSGVWPTVFRRVRKRLEDTPPAPVAATPPPAPPGGPLALT
jgi:transposase